MEALAQSSPPGVQVPQKLSGTKDVHFFSVGTLQGRTLIIYMKKYAVSPFLFCSEILELIFYSQLNSVFRVLEPLGNKGVKSPARLGSSLGPRSTNSKWFRIYRDFYTPSDSFDVIFLQARIAIFAAKGFEILNLHE